MLNQLQQTLLNLKNPHQIQISQKFFKTASGEYGAGDIFWGIKVPTLRKIAKQFFNLTLVDLKKLLQNNIHEFRFIALIILIEKYQKWTNLEKTEIFKLYLQNTTYINNWDLVDVSAPKIIGHYLLNKNNKILFSLAQSKNLWEKRIAIISTFEFIKNNNFGTTLKISTILLKDEHDLIHKAVGWMLREVGKKDLKTEENFLQQYYQQMSRTMLRYAIEKFPETQRLAYLKGLI